MRKKVCDTLSELASELLENEGVAGWPNLLQSLLELVNHPGASQREMALEVFSRIASYIIPHMSGQLHVLVAIIQSRLGDVIEVRVAAMRALCSFMYSVEESSLSGFQPLLPFILAAINEPAALSPEAEAHTKEMLEILVEFVEYSPRFFRPSINDFCSLMVSIVGSPAISPAVRYLAMEFLVTLAESKATIARKVVIQPGNVPFPRAVMQLCMNLMIDIEEEDDFATTDEDVTDAEDVRSMDVGAQALDRVSMILGAKTSIPVAFELINESLQLEATSHNWHFAHCALHAMCQIVEVAKDTEFADSIQQQVIACSSQMLQHQHPRIRYMALQSMGQLLLDHGPDVQNTHHHLIVPALLSSMNPVTNSSPRVRSHACAAMINFVDYCESDLLSPYLNDILSASLGLMQVGPRIVQEQAIAIVSSASMVMEDKLGEAQYSMLMPLLQSALNTCPSTEDYGKLRGRILDCISLLGSAVPKERFINDVMPVMVAMAQASQGGLKADDPQHVAILKAWVRIGKVLGPDFMPYLDMVMPPILSALEAPVEQELSQEQIESEEAEFDSDTECVIQQPDGKLMQVRTSALEEQATAAHMVMSLADALTLHFYPHVARVSASLAPLAATSVHDGVRSYAMAALPALVNSVAQNLALQSLTNPSMTQEERWQPLREILKFFFDKLLESFQEEGEMELLLTSMQALKMVIENACRKDWSHVLPQPTIPSTPSQPLTPETCQQLLNREELTSISTILIKSLAESVQRRALARAEAATDEDYDQEQEEFDMMKGAEEEEVQFNIAELIGSILKTHGSQFLPILVETKWFERLNDFSQEHSLLSDRKIAAYIYCDVIEYCDEAVVPLLDLFMPALLRGVDSDEPQLRQPCAYGVGISSNKLETTQWVQHALQHLSNSAAKPGAREGEQESATDNVVAAICTMCIQLSDHPVIAKDGDQLWDQYMSYLPLRSDVEESSKVTMQLCKLTRSNHMGLLGDQMKRLPRVWTVICGAIGEKGSTQSVHGEIAATVQFLSSSLSPEQMGQLWAMLTPQVADKARTLVSN